MLVGGGPSLRNFPFSRLRGRTVVAINDAILHLPWATAAFSADTPWMNHRQKEIMEFHGERYLCIAPDSEVCRSPGVEFLWKIRLPGLSTQPDCLHLNGTSGAAAINLAVLKGAKKIWLLGYDGAKGAEHWFDGYPWQAPSSDPRLYPLWNSHFHSMLPQLGEMGVEVLNCNLDSAIDAFPKVPILEVLKEAYVVQR